MTIGADGINWWNRGYVDCAMAGPWSGPNDLASWWLYEGSEQWAMVYRMQTECNFDAKIRAAQPLPLPHAYGVERQPWLCRRADGKAHVILAGGGSFTKKDPGAMVCHCCGKNRETVLQQFGGAKVAMAGIEGRPRLTAVFRDIPSERRIPYYGGHGVLRVSHCAANGMVGVLREHGGMWRPSTAKVVRDSINGAQKVARTARPG